MTTWQCTGGDREVGHPSVEWSPLSSEPMDSSEDMSSTDSVGGAEKM